MNEQVSEISSVVEEMILMLSESTTVEEAILIWSESIVEDLEVILMWSIVEEVILMWSIENLGTSIHDGLPLRGVGRGNYAAMLLVRDW